MAQNTSAIDLKDQNEEIPPVKVKIEKQDDPEDTPKSSGEISTIIVNNPQLSQLQARNITITVAVGSASSGNGSGTAAQKKSTPQTQTKTAEPPPAPSKPEPPPIDFPSICGAFGWTTIGTVHLPFIMRGEDRFVAVRMVECKIIGKYADILPWTVFTCTNIKSYYITENEGKLFNEINGYHCEFQFGYQTFSSKDVVVRLGDTVKFYEFLESCRTKLQSSGGNPIFKEQCGFVMINCSPVPYVRKGTTKYVLLNMVYQEGVPAPVSTTERVEEWDLAYLRFLFTVTNMDQRSLKTGAAFCSLDDLQQMLGLVHFEEWWPNMQYSSKPGRPVGVSECALPKWGSSVAFMHPDATQEDSSHKLREKMNEIQAKENVFNPFLELEKYAEINRQASKSPRVVNQHDPTNSVQNTQSNNRGHHLFPSSLEGLLAAPTQRDYSQSLNYPSRYGSHSQMQSSMMPDINVSRHLNSEGGLSALATSRPRPFPPPPPLVRLGGMPRSNAVPVDHGTVPKPPTSLYPYLQPSVTPGACPPWLARVLEPDWLREDESRKDPMHQPSESATLPEGLSRRLSGEDPWDAINMSSGVHMNGAGSSNVRNNYAVGRVLRENYDPNYNSICRDDRVMVAHGGSPRPAAGPGPPPHYPTPPQSSPLQPLSVLECSTFPGLTDIYATQVTPNGMVDMCSPPPSPDTRTILSSSPRGSYVAPNSYQAHTVRLAQVDSRYVLAINVEPHKHNSVLAIPISDVVTKFLRGTSVQSCQVVLETVFGLQLFECTSLHQEAYAKHNVPVVPGSKLVSVVDLRNYLYQLRFLLAEREKQKERNIEVRGTETELPLAKRWCGNEQES